MKTITPEARARKTFRVYSDESLIDFLNVFKTFTEIDRVMVEAARAELKSRGIEPPPGRQVS